MAKQLNVDLRFTASGSQAKAQIQDLQSALNNLITTAGKNTTGLGITKDIAQATNEVAKLQAMLESSKNSSGGLDLGKFNQSLAQGQMKISDYAKTLSSLGPQGDQAFAKLAKAIINAEVPLKRTNSILKEFKTSLANTARWQLSSSMLHGFMGAVQSAYGYAQDLNESLNNIRIVTGQNTDQMASFAKEANKAAQALSTTTTEYTNASLIYYQQGLSDAEVAKRTEVTIKMANAAGQSATVVSDQLTAIWNNFYDGSKSLEYYADVMTALGAATASSTDEIAGGLEKFAAIGQTIGLSYEYAASALATITANSRESEEVVGTALKTIFARIQGLNLGETLDDGVTLNKYSEALATVGISIFESNGELKKMDNILDELGEKWSTLNKAQQTALAQTVAGVRQYNQLMSLMNNWDNGDTDSMKANLDTAYNATGTLQEQADIYAESWEAASDRVTAAAEEIYNQLLNDKFFIELNNGFAGFLNIISDTIDALGGLPGVLSVASSIMFKMFGKDMAKAIDDWAYNIKLRSQESVDAIKARREEASQTLKNLFTDNVDTGPVNAATKTSFESAATIADALLAKREQLLQQGKELSLEDQIQVEKLQRANDILGEQVISAGQLLEKTQLETKELEAQVRQRINRASNKTPEAKTDLKNQLAKAKKLQTEFSALENVFNKFDNKKFNTDDLVQELQQLRDAASSAGMDINTFDNILDGMSTMSADEALAKLSAVMTKIGDDAADLIYGTDKIKDLRSELQALGMSSDQIDKLIDSWTRQGVITADLAQKLKNVKVQGEEASKVISSMQGPPPTVGQQFTAVANTISNIAMAINNVKGLIDTWNNEDMSFGEKLLATFTSLGMVIPMLTNSLSKNNIALLSNASASIASAFGLKTVDLAAEGATISVTTLWGALWPIAAVMAAVALAAWGLSAAWKAMQDASPEGQLKQANKEAQELHTALDDAKNSAKELEEAFNNYDNAVTTLENCTRGTEEWYTALQDVNDEVIKLLSLYPELSKYIEYGDYGELKISEAGREAAFNASDQRVRNAQAASVAADQGVREARITVETSDLAEALNKQKNTTTMKQVNEETIDYSAFVSRYIAENAKEFAGKTREDQAAMLQKYFDSNNLIGSVQPWIDAIEQLGPEFVSLINSIDQNTLATKAENKALAANAIANNDTIRDSEYAKEITAASGTIYESLYEQQLQKLKTEKWGTEGIAQWNGANQKAKEIWNDYLAAANLSAKENYLVDTTGNDNNRQFVFGEEKKTIPLEAMQQAVASARALEALGASAETLIAVFTDLSTSGNSADLALKSIIANEDLSEATYEEAQSIKEAVDTDKQDGVSQQEALDYVINRFGAEYDFTQLGYESAEAMATAIADGINGVDEKWQQIGEDLKGSAQKAFQTALSDGLFDNFTLEEVETVADSYQRIFEQSGTEGVKILDNIFRASGDSADELSGILAGVDWQTTNVFELSELLENAGIEADGFADQLAKLIELMKDGQNTGFEAASEHYNIMQKMADLKEGDSITQEEYKYLQDAGIDASEYFKLMGDGSYHLKEDAEEFYQIVNEKSLDVFKSNIEAMYREIGSVDGVMRRRTEDTIADNNLGDKGYNRELVSDQLTFLEALDINFENLESYQQIVAEGGTMSKEVLQEIQQLVAENKERWDELPETIQKSAVELEKHQQASANSASTVDKLNRLYEEQFITLEQYQEAVDEVMENEFEMEGLDPDAAEEVADAFRDMAEAGVEGMEALKNDEEAVKDATVRYMELNEAIEDIYDNYKDYTQVLKDVRNATSKADAANTDSAKKLKVSMAGLLGTTEDMIDADLLAAIDPKDFEAAANGNADAIERIREKFIELQYDGLNAIEPLGFSLNELMNELNQFNDGAYIDLDNTEFLNKLIQAAVNADQTAAEIEAMLSGFGIDADVTPFTEELWKATQDAQAAGENIANATSFTTEVQQEPVDNVRTTEIPQFSEKVNLIPRRGMNYVTMSNGFARVAFESQYVEAQKSVDTSVQTVEHKDTQTVSGQTVKNGAGASGKGGVIVKNAHKAPAASKAPSAGNTSRPPVSSGGGGGGSKEKEPSKPKKIDYTKQEEVVKRYKEIDDTLDDLTDEYDRASMAADRLWGEHRLDALREQNKLIEEQQELLREKQKQAENYMKQDQIALQQAASQAGLSFSFDENGNISNYTGQMEFLYEQLANAEAYYNSLGTGEEQDAYEEAILEPLKDKIKNIEDAMELYEESKELFEQLGIDIEDLEDQIMQNNYDIIMEGLELKISFNEDDLEVIDYYLSKIEDDFYKMAEAASLMVGPEGVNQLEEYQASLEEYENAINELTRAYQAGEITEVMYVEGMKECKEGILDNLESLNELDKKMKEYYSETIEAAMDELSKYTDRLEHSTEVLEHYGNMMEILGKSMDYDALGIILQGQVDTIENEMKVAEAAYNMYQQQADQKKKLLDEAIARGDEAAAEIYQKEWEAATEAAMEAQSDMLDKTEEWAEAMRAVVENELAGLAKSLEQALTGGSSFDNINTQLERAVSLQEEYLTTTNQIYETNKLMRTAQQEIDKTTNLVAKQRLKDFIKETNQLQDKSKLSKYELEIQEAKYNLLLAQIALEDAQDAKSMVRLQRDSEGNFGYIYTADQSKLAEAEQRLEDAQNELYNIGLEGASDYTEKYTETMEEMYDTLTSITEAYYNGEIASQEEYEAQMLAAQEYYYQQLENYQDLYGIALQTDTRVIQDSWTSGFRTMINNTETWKDKVAVYTADATTALSNWYNKVEEISNKTGLDNIAGKVENVTDKSDELRDVILGNDGEPGVVDALRQELDAVGELTRYYATFRDQLQGTIRDYEELITQAINLNRANQEAIASSNAAVQAAKRAQEANYSYSSVAGSSSSSSGGSGSSSSSSSGGGGGTANKYKATYSLQGRSNTVSGYTSEAAARSAAESAIQAAVNALTGITFTEKSSMAASAKSSISIARYDTGGYTGSWGPYGKLGILDEKELILDKNDTANFLASMEVLERILEIIDLQAINAQLGGALATPSIHNGNTTQTIEQSVHIEASFPGVQDRLEIEEAFNTLINKASQYANRK